MPMYKRGEEIRVDENLDVGVATLADKKMLPMICIKFADLEVLFSQSEAAWLHGRVGDALLKLADDEPRIIVPK